jgi:hypothetical protein
MLRGFLIFWPGNDLTLDRCIPLQLFPSLTRIRGGVGGAGKEVYGNSEKIKTEASTLISCL